MLSAVYTFRCPVCDKRFRQMDPGEPCCTGPSESSDDHEMVTMRLTAIDCRVVGERLVPSHFAERRAHGMLIMPDMAAAIERELRAIVHR